MKTDHNCRKKTTSIATLSRWQHEKPARSYLCLSLTSLWVIEEPYKVNAHCFNTPTAAHCSDDGSSTGAERKVSVGRWATRVHEGNNLKSMTSIQETEVHVSACASHSGKRHSHPIVDTWKTCVSEWLVSYCGQISWGCTGLQLSLPSSAQWRKSSPDSLQGLCVQNTKRQVNGAAVKIITFIWPISPLLCKLKH